MSGALVDAERHVRRDVSGRGSILSLRKARSTRARTRRGGRPGDRSWAREAGFEPRGRGSDGSPRVFTVQNPYSPFDEGVAKWARRSPPRGSVAFAPLVLGPAELRSSGGEDSPGFVTLEAIVQLAALQHPRSERDRRAAEATVLAALRKLLEMAPSPARKTLVNLIHETAGAVPTLCATLEKLLEDYGMGALDLIKKEGRAEGRAEGLSELRQGLVLVLDARGRCSFETDRP